jgi:hypothetical protein
MRPNLFIIGAPKCGTSSLFDWLASHPEIRGSRIKETFFLVDPRHPLSRRPNLAFDGMAAYDTYFDSKDAREKYRMEATTHYLYDHVARQAISKMPDAHVIVVLREPAARVYSSFQYTANNLARLPAGLTFSEYVQTIEDGAEITPDLCPNPASAYVLSRDIEYSRYINYLAPWFDCLCRKRLRVLVMENMIRDPDDTLRKLINWLDLDAGDFQLVDTIGRNRTENIRNSKVHALVSQLNACVRPPEPLRHIVKSLYGLLQYRKMDSPTEEDYNTLKGLKSKYVEDNVALSELAELDLSIWN